MRQEKMLRNLGPQDIKKYQQNRHPLLLVDLILEVNPKKSAIGLKNYSYNEWFFPAHFEDEPVVPGFVLIESLTQVFLMTFLTIPGNEGKKTAFVEIESAKFHIKVVPGDSLRIEAELEQYSHGVARGYAKGFVGPDLACSLQLVVAIPEVLNARLPRIKD
jgi:3-hydroxyacyl-[acyl-carrier-protein] dehydratase